MATDVSTTEQQAFGQQAFADIPAILQDAEVQQLAADPRLREYHAVRSQHADLDAEIDAAQRSSVSLRNKGPGFDLASMKRKRLKLKGRLDALESELGITPLMKNMMLSSRRG